MSTIAAAETRHSVHQVPIMIGWMTMKKMLTAPSGMTRTPNIATIHGMVRQRRRPPISPDSASSR